MDKNKIIIFTTLCILIIILLQSVDVRLKYDLSLIDYYRYNKMAAHEESQYLEEKSLIVGIYNDPPLTFSNEYNNQNAGILVDYISQLEIESGASLLMKIGSNETIEESLLNGEIDTIMTYENYTEKSNLISTQALCSIDIRILLHNSSKISDLNKINNATLILPEKYRTNNQIQGFIHAQNIKIIEVENLYQAFALLDKNKAEGLIGSDMEISHFLKVTNRTLQFQFLKGAICKEKLFLAVKSDSTLLYEILNKSILNMKKKNLILQTQKKWLGDYESDNVDIAFLDTIYKVVIAVCSIIFILTSWNYVITKRVNSKTKELLESKEDLRLIIDTMKNGLIVLDDKSTILECNDIIAKYTGVSREKLLGYNAYDFEILTLFLKHKNSSIVLNIDNAYYYISSQNLATNRRMIIIDNYTEQYFSEKRARQEEKMIAIGRLSAGLAHEIRNPLGLIKSYGFILEKQSLNSISIHAISVIYDSISRINDLIENLLKFSRLSNYEKKSVLISDLIPNIIDLEYDKKRLNDIIISVNINLENEQVILINKELIRMILVNLINNSIDSLNNIDKNDKVILVSVFFTAHMLHIQISDNGEGIDPLKLEHIFDPFYSTKEDGTGLGLYIISTEIQNSDGQISVESTLGEGTCFDINLPIERTNKNEKERL